MTIIIMVLFPSFPGLTGHSFLIGRAPTNKRRREGQADPMDAKKVHSLRILWVGEAA